MKNERFQRVRELFLSGCRLAPLERRAFLEEACAGDRALRAEVESLLEHDDGDDAAAWVMPAGPPGPPRRLGEYRILDVIGTGGMGVVYRAEQDHPRRTVALKVIAPGILTDERLRRFEYEAEALGRLSHPGIARIFAAGCVRTRGAPEPYIAMELVEGESLRRFADARELDVRARLSLLADVCDAVHHAHLHGVIHRDLKPDNILVDGAGQTKVVDFGVARPAGPDQRATGARTVAGHLVGTVAYMSPEHVAGGDLDVRGDVYALGVIGYELLTGRLPYDLEGRTLAEAVRLIRESEPPRPGTRCRSLRGDPETILGKALEKDRDRRYASAADLGGDIRRFLADEPLKARPASSAYRLRKFTRRHRGLVLAAAAIFAVLTGGVIATASQAVRATAERNQARLAQREAARHQAEAEQATRSARAVQAFLEHMLGSIDPEAARGRDTTVLREMLDEAARRVDADLVGQPRVEAEVRLTIGRVYNTIGRWDEALAQHRLAVERRRAAAPPDPAGLAEALGQVGAVLVASGRPNEAEPVCREALALSREARGERREARGERREVHAERHPDVAAAADDLADVLLRVGVGLETRPELRGALRAEAEGLVREALALRRERLGPVHRDTVESIRNLAALRAGADPVEAERLYREALSIMIDTAGDDSRDVATLRADLGALMTAQRRHAEARRLLERSIGGYVARLGPDHPHVHQVRFSLGYACYAEGDHAAAEPEFRAAREGFLATLGPDHQRTLDVTSFLALAIEFQGRYAEALPLARAAHEAYARVHGPDHLSTARAAGNLGRLLNAMGEPAEAEPVLERSLESLRAALGEAHPNVAATLGHLGEARRARGDAAGAEPLLRRSLDIFAALEPPDARALAIAEGRLGACLAELRRFDDSEDLLRRSHAALADDARELARARERLARLYETWGRPDDAARWRAGPGE